MKQRSTTPVSNVSLATRACVIAATVLTLVITPVTLSRPAFADKYDEQIKALEGQINNYNSEASRLKGERLTYETKLASLTAEKNQIQAQLDKSIVTQKQLESKIVENEKKIKENQLVLGDTLADMYIDSGVSPLEMLASSNNIADYVDKQANQEQVQSTVQTTIDEINKIKKELEKQKKEVDQVIADQTYQKTQLTQKENEQAKLIADTKGQEDAFQALSGQMSAQKQKVEQQQQAEIQARLRANNSGGGSAVAGDPSKGGYPSNLAHSDYYNPVVDPWGMYSRQCVSYTAWKVYQKNGHMPYWGGRGNANQWPGNARAAGIQTSSVPRAGSVGVISAGQYGHVVWVESVNSNGTINISQYNEWNAGGSGWGNYSERYNVNPSTYDTYIYF